MMLRTHIMLTGLLALSLCSAGAANIQSDKNGHAEPSHYILINGVQNTEASFQEIAETYGKSQAREISVGIGFIISALNMTPERAAQTLKRYLSLSVQYDVPILVQLDGESWWHNRPDLWNWWDKSKPGYDPENRHNVEWTDWTPDSAVKIGWRNWGRQLRVLPMPNLMSPAYREATRIEMRKLMTIVMAWWNGLNEDQEYLLAGVKLGWESSIGVNNWYYPNGNSYLDKPEKDDPTHGIKINQIPDRGVTTLGYAAVKTAGIADSGILTGAMQTEVVRRHLEDWCQLASEVGVPRERLFTHCGAWSQGESLYSAALNRYSCPGWSFYSHAENPAHDRTVMEMLERSDAPYWAATEWLYQGKHSKDQWVAALENTLIGANARYVCIYNWGDIKKNEAATEAIKQVSHAQRVASPIR